MRNVRFKAEVIKELRRLARDQGLTESFKAALVKIYTTGYDNGQEALEKLYEESKDVSNQVSQDPSRVTQDIGVPSVDQHEESMPKS